jgi:D-alanyl-lipoteichoic acid acyltransferase DltB (MBOAT superfamily)
MIFNSWEFILIYLPLVFAAFAVAQRYGGWQSAYVVLGLASLIFYGFFSPLLLGILSVSVVSNFVIGNVLISAAAAGKPSRSLLIFAILGNLGALAYFKYSNFLIDIANQYTGGSYSHLDIILPIGISFYTFIQIGYLVEANSGQVKSQPFSRYLTFATFFPCVTAGPLVMQKEFFSQLEDRTDSFWNGRRIAAGLIMFSMGLFKKVVFADSIAPFANNTFDAVAGGQSIDIVAAWVGALAYTLQLYFDFSGYSDMALGLGAIFGILLPLNFNSPFKATNISDFWQRWHMTMTRFFTTFVFSPLAVSGMRSSMKAKHGPVMRFLISGAGPIVLTMFVAGIWHGAGWVFVVYGVIHGVAIAINNGWRQFSPITLPPVIGWMLTMSVVVSGLVIFRAADVSTALTILAAMWAIPTTAPDISLGMVTTVYSGVVPVIAILGAVVLLLPNSHEILSAEKIVISDQIPALTIKHRMLSWRPTAGWAFATATLIVIGFANIGSKSSFLYYQF